MDLKKTTFMGYRRENNRVGVRNHVIILPLDDLSNAAAEAVANNIKAVLPFATPMGGFNLVLTLSSTSAHLSVRAVTPMCRVSSLLALSPNGQAV